MAAAVQSLATLAVLLGAGISLAVVIDYVVRGGDDR